MISLFDDTIAGISTAFAPGAIAIVRVSGVDAISVVQKIFSKKNLITYPSHTIHYGYIQDSETKATIDEVMVSILKAPKTYTKEDVVEISCHGGLFVTNQIYEQLLLNGARPAEAGEFTKRAFLNGRIDLTQAEAVMDMIEAENNAAVKMATTALKGAIKILIEKLRSQLMEMIAIINVNIDYPEYDDVEELTNHQILPKLQALRDEIIKLIDQSKSAKYLKNGIDTAIIGRPNVGKSSILNALLEENKAIVTEIPGTTRDVIEGKMNLGQITLNLIDTAGIRKTNDVVEQIGVSKSYEKLDTAELILFILDGSQKVDIEDKKILQLIQNKSHIIVINKTDLPKQLDLPLPNALYISSYQIEDIDLLKQTITNKVLQDNIVNKDITYISNARQIKKLQDAQVALNTAIEVIAQGDYIDFVEMYLRTAWFHLGEIIGQANNETLLDELFSRFCLGK